MIKEQSRGINEPASVRIVPHITGKAIPLTIEPKEPRVSLARWAGENRDFIEPLLWDVGALLFRNFKVETSEDFHRFIGATSDGKLLEYRDRSTPRHEVGARIYTATDYPAAESILLHSEGTYWVNWPLKIYFWCLVAPRKGGQTPIADCRRVLKRLSPRIRRRFERKKWMLVRNFGEGMGLPWQEVFQTNSKKDVEAYCEQNNMVYEWKGEGKLQIRQTRNAIGEHPISGTKSWFNHAAFFHISSLDPLKQETLLAELGEENMPYSTRYGDGSPIEDHDLDEIREAYRQETAMFSWQEGDVMVLDNMSVAHAREPFEGPRKILVGMADKYAAPC